MAALNTTGAKLGGGAADQVRAESANECTICFVEMARRTLLKAGVRAVAPPG